MRQLYHLFHSEFLTKITNLQWRNPNASFKASLLDLSMTPFKGKVVYTNEVRKELLWVLFGVSIMSNNIMVFAKEASRARARAMVGLQQSFFPFTWIVLDDQLHVYKVIKCSHVLACTCYEKFLSLFYFTEKK